MKPMEKRIRISDKVIKKLSAHTDKLRLRSMSDTVGRLLDTEKKIKEAHARLKKENPEIYHQFVGNIFN
jgi:hypothetical protein